MPYKNSKLVHIYGFTIDDTSKHIEIKSPAQLFKLQFYGNTKDNEDGNMHYVGIEIGRESNPFKRLCATQHGHFQMSSITPSDDVISLMKSLYPECDLKCHSFLSDVYTSHYYAGEIMVGYFFSSKNNYTLQNENAENNEHCIDPLDMDFVDIVNEDINDVYSVVDVAHTLENTLGTHFFGKRLSDEFVEFDFSHDDEPGHNFYKMCTQIYDIDKYKFNFTFKAGFVSSNKVIAFVPRMCYCCT